MYLPVYHPEPAGAHWSLIRIRAQEGEGGIVAEHFDSADTDRGDGGGGWQKRAKQMLTALLLAGPGGNAAFEWKQCQVGHQTCMMGCGMYVGLYMASMASAETPNTALGTHQELTPAHVNDVLRPRFQSAFKAAKKGLAATGQDQEDHGS